jgi:hypothetical protein
LRKRKARKVKLQVHAVAEEEAADAEPMRRKAHAVAAEVAIAK